MFLRRKMWLDVDQMLGANPSEGLMPSSFWNFYHSNYAAAQSIAIRRQADKRGDTSSLWRLLKDIARKPDLLTREVYVALLSEEQARDELMVERANRGWEKWADFCRQAVRRDDRERRCAGTGARCPEREGVRRSAPRA